MMLGRLLQPLRRALHQIDALRESVSTLQRQVTAIQTGLGRVEARQCAASGAPGLAANEFQVFSQWGEDGILQHLLREVAIARKVFVEFGVENYTEANTRFLLVECGWSGLVIDGSERNVRHTRRDPLYWRHNLKAAQAFITRENINTLLAENGVTGEIGLLSVDIDGVDYWVWEALTVVQPALVVAEYNALFGPERAVTVPYDAAFVRGEAHSSHVYYGASLAALCGLARRKGLAFVGTNRAGNNAFFVRRDLLPAGLPELTPEQGFTQRCFREGRNPQGDLLFLDPAEEEALIRHLPLVEVER